MRILVFGAGAIGSLLGGLLSTRHDVLLIGRKSHVDAIREGGLRISGKTVRITKPQAATRVPRRAKADLVVIAVKAYDTRAAMMQLSEIPTSSTFLTLQNGLGNADVIARTAVRVVAGTTEHGVTFVGPGEIRHAGVGETVIGRWRGVDEAELVRVRDVLDAAGVPTRVTSDVRTELWAKVLVNASINPLAALAGVPNGRLVRDKRLRSALEAVCREASAVARAEGAAVDPTEIVQRTTLVARRTADNRSSMLQDLDLGRRTEIDAITGAILRAADRHAIPVPLNRALHALVKARERRLPSSTQKNQGMETA